MDCKEFSLIIDALVDNELNENEKEKALHHVEECESCKIEFEYLLELKNSFKGLVKKSDKSVADSVIAQIRNEAAPKRKTPFFIRHMGLAASLVFIAAIAVYTGVQRNVSDMNISEERASGTDAAENFVADIKNSAVLDSDVYYTTAETFSDKISFKGAPIDYEKPSESIELNETLPEEAPEMPKAESEEFKEADAAVVKIFCDTQKVLPLLCDFEIIEYTDTYIVVKAEDQKEVKKIIEEN